MPAPSLLRFSSEEFFSLKQNQLLVVLLAFASVMIFTGIGLRSPWPADEPRFAEIAREMVVSGQWLIPLRGGEFYPDKPPVFMWSIALVYWLTGDLKISFLLPNALCSLLTLALTFDIGTRLWNKRIGAIAFLLLMLAPQFLIQAHKAQIDAMLACWITVACYGLIRHFFCGPAWGWYFTAWAFMGIGVITKGVGFLPALIFFPILALGLRDRQLSCNSLTWRCTLGPLIMIAVISSWLIPMALYVNNLGTEEAFSYRNNILFKQTGTRYADSWSHIKPWHYYLTNAIPSLWFPLPLLFLALIRPYRKVVRNNPVILVLLVWTVLVVTFFSFSPGKRGVYILPALPMFALSIAPVLGANREARWFRPFLAFAQALFSLALIGVGVMAWRDFSVLVEKVSDYGADPERLHEAGTLVFCIGLIGLVSLGVFWRFFSALKRFFIALMISWLFVTTWGYRILEPLRTPRNILKSAEDSTPPDAQLGMIDFREQFILFSNLTFTHFSHFSSLEQQNRNAWLWMRDTADSFLIVAEGLELECFTKEDAVHLGSAHRESYLLLTDEQMKPGCASPDDIERFTTPTPGSWQN